MSGYWAESAVSRFGTEFSAGPNTGFADNRAASLEAFRMTNQTCSEFFMFADAYGRRIAEIERRTGKKLSNPMFAVREDPGQMDFTPQAPARFSKSVQIGEFEDQVEELRKEHPDIPGYQDMVKDMQERAKGAEARAIDFSDRATFIGKVGALMGDMQGAIEDPAVLMTLPFGASAASGILRTAVVEGLIAGGTEILIQPQIQKFREELGLDAGFAQGAANVLAATGGGALFGGAVKGAATGLEKLSGRKLLDAFDKIAPKPTREQKTARAMYERILDEIKASPLSDLPSSLTEHKNRLIESVRAAEEARPVNIPERPQNALANDLDVNPDHLDGLVYSFDPEELKIDAKTFQFKEGGDQFGVTDRLKGVTQWDAAKAGQAIVFEAEDGTRFVADGHQRAGLAKRIKAKDPSQDVKMYGLLYREADGYTPEDVRMTAALTNISQGTGTAVDAAKVLRMDPSRIRELPPNSILVKQARDLANLSGDAFGMVYNEVVPANYAAIAGRLVDDPDMQLAVLDVLAKTEPANVTQAESIVRQATEAGFARETQSSLFGEEMITTSLFAERANVLDKALKKLKSDRRVFDTLVSNEGRIAQEGNVLASDANLARAQTDATAAQMIQQLANRKGKLSDALSAAAKRAKEDGRYTKAVEDFVGAVRRSVEVGDFRGAESGGFGRIDEVESEIRAGSEEAVADESLALFDEPAGKGQEEQTKALEQDIRRDIENTRGQGVFYHGTSKKIERLAENPADVGSEVNYYGDGFYTTDAVDIAKGYTKKGKGAEPIIYQITEKEPVRFYKMERDVDEALLEYLADLATNDDLVAMSIEAFDGNSFNLRVFYDEMRDISVSEAIPAYEVQERFSQIADFLQQRGYGGLEHLGGLRTGKKEHTVKIYFDPARQIEVQETGAIDKTAVGDQRVIEGAERISGKENIESKANQKIRPKAKQKAADDGLFDVDARGQSDLMDMRVPVGETIDEAGEAVPVTKTAREILEDLDADESDLEAIGRCST
jgi:hypothetical protein